MLAKAADVIPRGDGWLYEPKWDGFRCIVFRDGDELELASRNERPFTRYFPELLGPLRDALPDRCVVDGEIVVAAGDDRGLDFDALLQRIHPAESRVQRLAAETPAAFVAFDLLALGDRSLLAEPLSVRHALLTEALTGPGTPSDPPDGPAVHLCPSTTDADVAERWFVDFEGGGLDGVVAKRLADPYTPDKRTMVKVKHERTADCVIAGYRMHKDGKGVGSLLLGLYDTAEDGSAGGLHHVGVAASFTVKRRTELLAELAPLTVDAVAGHPWEHWARAQEEAAAQATRLPGAQSRWNAGKDLSFVPLRVERVAEVTFGQLQGGRFRHGVQFLRWRPDREPSSCRYDQLDVATPRPFRDIVRRS
jgi:ATP-dependent DNA ligase